jgi:hypothetical protein
MMKIAVAAAALAAAFASCAFAADRLEVKGATSAMYMLKPHADGIRATSGAELVVDPVGAGHAMLDLIDGETQVALVTSSLADAVAAARVIAWTEHKRLLLVGQTLVYREVPNLDPNGRPLAFVTRGEPSPQLVRVINYLSTRYAARMALNR